VLSHPIELNERKLLECNQPNVVRNRNWYMDTFNCQLVSIKVLSSV